MIRNGTSIKILDNSGVSVIKSFGMGRVFRSAAAGIGDIVTGSVRKTKNPTLSNGTIVKCLVVQAKSTSPRKGGSSLSFVQNSGITWNVAKGGPRASRVLCPVPLELRTLCDGGSKVVAMSPMVL
jgi:ribosomal protein L14